jgi:hypothetical protein
MSSRFGQNSAQVIEAAVNKLTPVNTKKSRDSAWRQFQQFCDGRKYNLNKETSRLTTGPNSKRFRFQYEA